MSIVCSTDPLSPLNLNILPSTKIFFTDLPSSLSSFHFKRRVTDPRFLLVNFVSKNIPSSENLALTPGEVEIILKFASVSFPLSSKRTIFLFESLILAGLMVSLFVRFLSFNPLYSIATFVPSSGSSPDLAPAIACTV